MLKANIQTPSVISFQYIGDYILRHLIKITYPLTASKACVVNTELITYEESSGVRYAAGYVVRSLQKNTWKSTHPDSNNM